MYDYDFAKYEGLYIPTVTPFTATGDLDLKKFLPKCRIIRRRSPAWPA